MRSFPTFLVMLFVLTALVIAPPAAGDDGDCHGDVITIGLGDATPFATTYYVVTGETPDQGYGYFESNGVSGLQRGGWINKWGPMTSIEVCWSDHPAGYDFWFY